MCVSGKERGEERKRRKERIEDEGVAEMAKAGGWELLPQGFPSTSPTFHHSAPSPNSVLGMRLYPWGLRSCFPIHPPSVSHSVVSDFAAPWTVARQAPPSMGFSG